MRFSENKFLPSVIHSVYPVISLLYAESFEAVDPVIQSVRRVLQSKRSIITWTPPPDTAGAQKIRTQAVALQCPRGVPHICVGERRPAEKQ